jgi:hypothetical protein
LCLGQTLIPSRLQSACASNNPSLAVHCWYAQSIAQSQCDGSPSLALATRSLALATWGGRASARRYPLAPCTRAATNRRVVPITQTGGFGAAPPVLLPLLNPSRGTTLEGEGAGAGAREP